MPKVSLVVAVRNNVATIEECIRSLLNLDYPNYEILIIDGNSTDGTREKASKFPVKILNNPNRSASSGRNLGIKEARGYIVAFTDGDCIVDEKWLETCVKNLIDNEGIAGVGGPNLTPLHDPYAAQCIGLAMATHLGSAGSVQGMVYPESRFVESISSCNAVYWRKVLETVGGFNEHLAGTAEDAELNYRIQKAGYKILYLPDAVVYHHRRSSLKKFFKQLYGYGFWRGGVIIIHPDMFQLRYAIPYGLGIFFLLSATLSSLIPWALVSTLAMLSLYFVLTLATGIAVFTGTRDLKHIPTIPLMIVTEHVAFFLGLSVGLLKGLLIRSELIK